MNKEYKNNMKYIKSLNIALYNKIKDTKITNAYINECKNGMRNVLKKFNNNCIDIHSSYYPEKQAKYVSLYALEDNPDIVFLFGMGLGYELKEMIKVNSNTRYFIIEPDDEIFKLLVENEDIKYLFNNNNIYFIQDNVFENIVSFFEQMVYTDKTINIKFLILPAYKTMYKDLTSKLNDYLKEFLNRIRINIRTVNLSNRAWCQSFIANLKYLKETIPVSKLKNTFKDKPAIIVAAGPSLNYNLEKLKELQDKVIIAAVGTGMQILEKNGIKASLVGAIDVWKSEENLFDNLCINSNIPLFFSSHTAYKIPGILNGPKFTMTTGHMDLYISESLNWGENEFFTGPSIANTMAYNLSKLGCNPIIFLGQDLCYSDDKWYAEGAINNTEFSKDYFEENGFVRTRNRNNDEVYTINTFLAMKTSLEHCIKLYPHLTYLNGTKNGLNIVGAKNIDFNSYIDNIKESKEQYNINKSLTEVYEEHINSMDVEKINKFIFNLNHHNKQIINILMEVSKFLEDEHRESEKIECINKTLMSLNKFEFYDKVIVHITREIEFIYSSRSYIDKHKQMFAYILDKCLIMDNAFEYEVYGKV